MRNPEIHLLAVAALALSAAGCAIGPDASPTVAEPPRQFAELSTASPTAGVLPGEPSPDFAFWVELKDPTLTKLVERALGESPDVLKATARIRESRAVAGASFAALLPEISGNASYLRTRVSTQSPSLARINASSFPGFTPDSDDFRTSASMAYELDVWGKNRRAYEAAMKDLRADVERRRSVGLTLAGDVTTTYVDYRTLERRRQVAARALASRETALELVRDRERAGLATDLDLARAEADLANVSAVIPDLDKQLSIAEHRLSILVGATPGSLRATLGAAAQPLRAFPVPIGIPAALLARRPDIRESAERLAAATARIGQAKADLFPQIQLTGEIGLESLNASQLAASAAAYWTFGPTLRVPLFDAFRRVNSWTAAEERETEAYEDLAKQVLVALQETEDALVSVREDARRRERLATAAAASKRATDIATLKFQSGLIAFLDVIEAERVQFQSEDALAEAEGRVARNSVQLAKAVAGGFMAEEKLLPPIDPDSSSKPARP